ncbi:hypothetical protein Tco_0535111 [Tanacetum coccineum]
MEPPLPPLPPHFSPQPLTLSPLPPTLPNPYSNHPLLFPLGPNIPFPMLTHEMFCDHCQRTQVIIDNDVLSEVPHSDSYHNDMDNQSVHAMQDFEQTPVEKANQEKNNESVTAELERYKERVKTFEQRLNVDLSTREKMIDSQMDDMINEKLALK